jgi:HEPN domain-containing protein
MSATDKDIAQKVRQWIEYADEDLRLAEYALRMESGCPYRLIAYHAQQCVEKYIKAFLVYHRQDFPYTHNISALLELCRKHSDWMDSLSQAETLTAYAISARYPGEDEPVSLAEAQKAITIATQTKSTLNTLLINALKA